MECKNLAYSAKQLCEFLEQMEGVIRQDAAHFSYGTVRISLQDQDSIPAGTQQGQGSVRSLPRAYMYLQGEKAHIEAFYRKFMLYHMTMGG